MRNVVFWGLLPFLAPQALYVRRTAPRFAAADGPATGSAGTGESRRLIAIGDSIIAGVGAGKLGDALVGQTARSLAERLDSRIHWQAVGAVGYNTRKVLDRQERRVLEAGAHVDKHDAEAMHRLRIECKKLRYAAEFFFPILRVF